MYTSKKVTLEISGDVSFKMDGVMSKVGFGCYLEEHYPINTAPDLAETTKILRDWLNDDEVPTIKNFSFSIWLQKENCSYLSFSFNRTLPDDRMEALVRSLVSKLAEFDFQVTDPEPEFTVTEKGDGLYIEDIVTGTTISFKSVPNLADINNCSLQVYDYIVHGKPIDGVEIALGEGVVIDNPLGYNILVKLLCQLEGFIENPDDTKFRKLVITNA